MVSSILPDMPWSGDRKVYLARAISDFRTSTLESVPKVERASRARVSDRGRS